MQHKSVRLLPVPIALEYSGDNPGRLRDGGQSERKIAARTEVLDALVASAQTSAIAHGVQKNLSRWGPCQKVPRADSAGLRLLSCYCLGNGVFLSVSPG